MLVTVARTVKAVQRKQTKNKAKTTTRTQTETEANATLFSQNDVCLVGKILAPLV